MKLLHKGGGFGVWLLDCYYNVLKTHSWLFNDLEWKYLNFNNSIV